MAGNVNFPSGLTALLSSKEFTGIVTHLGVTHDSPVKKMMERSADSTVVGQLSFKRKYTLKEIVAHGFRAPRQSRPIDQPALSSATSTTRLDFDVINAEVYPSRQYQRLTFNDDDLSMRDGDGAMAKAIQQKIERAMEGKSRDDCRVAFGDGTGILGYVALTTAHDGTATTSVVDFQRDDQTNYYNAGKPGARWLAYHTGVFKRRGATVASSYAHLVDSIQPATSQTATGSLTQIGDTVTFTAALNANLADGDVFVSGDFNGDNYGNEPLGMNAWIDDGRRVPVIGGVNRLEKKRYGCLTENIYTTAGAPGHAAYNQAVTEVLFYKTISNAAVTTGATHFACAMHPEVHANFVYEAELYGGAAATTPFRARQNQGGGRGPGKFLQGYEDFIFPHPQLPGGVMWAVDFYCDFSTIVGFVPDTFQKLQWSGWKLHPGFGAGGMAGAYYYNQSTGDVEVTYSEKMQYVCHRPDQSFRIEHISNFAAGAARTID